MRKAILGLFIVITFLIFKPLLSSSWYPMHDSTHIARVYLLEKTIKSGQIPAIWASDIGDGAGYPLFHFYAPLVYYLSLFGKLLTGSYFVGIKIVLILATVVSLSGMYLLTRKWGRSAGIVASISYVLLPYAAINIYVRGAFAEYLAMSLLPWVFYVWTDLESRKKQVIATVITSLFLLSHNLMPLITAPFLLVWIILNKPKKYTKWFLPLIVTFTLSAFYLLPVLFERSFVMADSVARTTNYALHFVSPAQLWNSMWGYGGSGLGLEDGMSFKIGKIQLILAIIATVLIILRKNLKLLFCVMAGIGAYFMTTQYSVMIWQSIGTLSIVQFPWRFLALGGFFVSMLAGYSTTLVSSKVWQFIITTSVVLALLFFNLKYFIPQTTFPSNQQNYTNQSYINSLPNIIPEYQPSWSHITNAILPEYTILPQLYYPTWQVTLDSRRISAFPINGYLAFSNPTQSTDYSIKQVHTNLEYIAHILSLSSLIFLIYVYGKK